MTLRKKLATWLFDCMMEDNKNRENILTALTVDYNLIEDILSKAQEGSYVEFKLNNGNSIIIGKSDGKVNSRRSSVGTYY